MKSAEIIIFPMSEVDYRCRKTAKSSVITYPPELLPSPNEGDEIEVIVIDYSKEVPFQ